MVPCQLSDTVDVTATTGDEDYSENRPVLRSSSIGRTGTTATQAFELGI